VKSTPTSKISDSKKSINSNPKPKTNSNPILNLQQTIGNKAVTELLEEGIIQAKLEISTPGDTHEQEADSMASKVMRKEDDRVMTKPSQITSKPSHQQTTTQFDSSIKSTKGSGSSLDKSTRNFMESRFKNDFSNVKIHTDSNASNMSKSIHAKAFTIGNDIYFKSGMFNPASNSGKELLAHELTHTIQQKSSRTPVKLDRLWESDGKGGWEKKHDYDDMGVPLEPTDKEKKYKKNLKKVNFKGNKSPMLQHAIEKANRDAGGQRERLINDKDFQKDKKEGGVINWEDEHTDAKKGKWKRAKSAAKKSMHSKVSGFKDKFTKKGEDGKRKFSKKRTAETALDAGINVGAEILGISDYKDAVQGVAKVGQAVNRGKQAHDVKKRHDKDSLTGQLANSAKNQQIRAGVNAGTDVVKAALGIGSKFDPTGGVAITKAVIGTGQFLTNTSIDANNWRKYENAAQEGGEAGFGKALANKHSLANKTTEFLSKSDQSWDKLPSEHGKPGEKEPISHYQRSLKDELQQIRKTQNLTTPGSKEHNLRPSEAKEIGLSNAAAVAPLLHGQEHKDIKKLHGLQKKNKLDWLAERGYGFGSVDSADPTKALKVLDQVEGIQGNILTAQEI